MMRAPVAPKGWPIAVLPPLGFLRDKAKVPRSFGTFPKERMNPNGGSTAIGHPFGATGARIIAATRLGRTRLIDNIAVD